MAGVEQRSQCGHADYTAPDDRDPHTYEVSDRSAVTPSRGGQRRRHGRLQSVRQCASPGVGHDHPTLGPSRDDLRNHESAVTLALLSCSMEDDASLRSRITTSLTAGHTLDLIPDQPTHTLLDEATMRSWGAGHDVDADFLRDLLRCVDPGVRPDPRGLRLRGIRIRGRLDLDHVTTPVLLELQDCLLEDGMSADQGHLPMLALVRCRISNPSGIAVDADRLTIDGSLYFNTSIIENSCADGGIRLTDARVGGSIYFCSTIVRNMAGPAVAAEGLAVARDIVADGTCSMDGSSVLGTLILLDARVDGVLWARDATIRNNAGTAVHGGGLRLGRDLYLDGEFSAKGSGTTRATVHLSGAQIGGPLHIVSSGVQHDDDQYRWSFDGLVYQGVPLLHDRRDRKGWIDLLQSATPKYSAQAYQQVAAAYRAEGHDSDVRAILIAQRRDQVRRGGVTGTDLWWARLTGILLGYGYQPWRALLVLIAVLAASVALSVGLGAAGALAAGPPPRACTMIETIARGMDLGAPFLPRAPTSACTVTATGAGTILTIGTWLMQIAAWALAALFVAGFTGIVRRT